MFFKMLTHLNKVVQSKQFSKTLPFYYVPTCRKAKRIFFSVKCHSQLKVKNLLLRKAKILQNAKIAHQPSCISRFHQLLSDLNSNINIKQKSFRSVTHETSLSVMRQRAHKSLATGLAKCSK